MNLTFFQKRPLSTALAFYLLISFFSVYFHLKPIFSFILFSLSLLLFLLSFLKCRAFSELSSFRTALFLISFFLLLSAVLSTSVYQTKTAARKFDPEEEVFATLRVKTLREYDGVTTVFGELVPDTSHERFDTLLYFFGDTLILIEDERYLPLCEGDTVHAAFSLEALDTDQAEDLFHYADGYDLVGSYLHSARLISHQKQPFPIRETLSALIDRHLATYGKSMMKALLLADKTELSPKVKTHFSTLGISHLLAVSGLHLSILIGMIAYLLQRLSLDRRISYAILTLLIAFYATVTDFTPSLLRAGGMLLIFYLASYAGRQKDSITSLFLATAVIVTLSPRAIVDVGLLFSFLATLGILTLALPLLSAIDRRFFTVSPNAPRSPIRKLLRVFITSTVTTVSATAFVLPISFLVDGEVFLLSPLSNFLFAPLFTLLLYLLPLFLITCAIPIVGPLTALLIEWLSMAVNSLSYLAEILKPFSLSLGYSFLPYLVACLTVAAFLLLLFRKKAIAFLVLASFFVLAPLGILLDDAMLQNTESVSYYSDGKNDLLFVESEKHRLVVVSSASSGFVKKKIVSTPLTSPSVKLDTLFFTNLSSTHAILVYELWETGELSHVVIPTNYPSSDYLKRFAESLGIAVTSYTPNDTVLYNGIALTTHADTAGALKAITVQTETKSLLYLRENAPNDFDIRFGVMQKHHNTVILGTFGNEMKGSLVINADEVWEYKRRSYIVPQRNQIYRYGDLVLFDERNEKQQ